MQQSIFDNLNNANPVTGNADGYTSSITEGATTAARVCARASSRTEGRRRINKGAIAEDLR